ncbi:GTP 3',8-cyclase MoaA [bacterium SCSIO 12741]|nr:GTP 3',8-cyclase MoaA [bacterium SCSIO 12741]
MHGAPEIRLTENETATALVDSFGRQHTYLRISLTEKCNLRCTYCMPAEGLQLSPSDHLMTADEVIQIAQEFVAMGVQKIRLTGGEPLLRRDAADILKRLAELPVELAITTNGLLLDKFLPLFHELGIKQINLSLDTLDPERFHRLTRRNQFDRVMNNIQLALREGFRPGINVVLLRDQNDDEITRFIDLTSEWPLKIRFIEFMPFSGNSWDRSRLVSLAEVLKKAGEEFGPDRLERLQDKPNDTSKNFKVKGFAGSFSVISTVTNPFCDSCNRIRLTANGRLKNCLFSKGETDLLSALRQGQSIRELIQENLRAKKFTRAGMDTMNSFANPTNNQDNRSMILIGG